jgi:hypothetical protein
MLKNEATYFDKYSAANEQLMPLRARIDTKISVSVFLRKKRTKSYENKVFAKIPQKLFKTKILG